MVHVQKPSASAVLDDLSQANAELELLRARLIGWQQRHPGRDSIGAVSRAINELGAGSRVLMHEAIGGCPCDPPAVLDVATFGCCSARPLAIIGPGGDFTRHIDEHGATGECVASCGGRTAPDEAGKSGPSIDRRVVQAGSYIADAPGVRAQTSRPGLLKRLGQLLDVVA